MAAVDTTLTPLQQHTLQTVAHSFCEKLTAADAQKSYSQRTAPARIAVLRGARHEVTLAHGAALVAAFGQQLLTNEQLENSMWQNVGRLMFDECRILTAQLRIDQSFAELQASLPAPISAPKPTVAPRAAGSARPAAREK